MPKSALKSKGIIVYNKLYYYYTTDPVYPALMMLSKAPGAGKSVTEDSNRKINLNIQRKKSIDLICDNPHLG